MGASVLRWFLMIPRSSNDFPMISQWPPEKHTKLSALGAFLVNRNTVRSRGGKCVAPERLKNV